MVTTRQGLSYAERRSLVLALHRYVNNYDIEAITGYAPGYYHNLLDEFRQYGTPDDPEKQARLSELIFLANK